MRSRHWHHPEYLEKYIEVTARDDPWEILPFCVIHVSVITVIVLKYIYTYIYTLYTQQGLANTSAPRSTCMSMLTSTSKSESANNKPDRCSNPGQISQKLIVCSKWFFTQYQYLNIVSPSSTMDRLHCEVNKCLKQQMNSASSNTNHLGSLGIDVVSGDGVQLTLIWLRQRSQCLIEL